MSPIPSDRLEGCLLGGMVGDALGLPREGLSRRRAVRMYPGPLRHAFVLRRGLCSDDTEHAAMTAQALLVAARDGVGGGEGGDERDVDRYARSLAWRLRWWLLALPAGVGKATARAILKLWVGFPPSRSGVFSAGNGPAMRAPILGVALASAPANRLEEFARASTRLTHTDPRAERGALAVARAAAYAATHTRENWEAAELWAAIVGAFPSDDAEAARWLEIVRHAVAESWDADRFCAEAGFPDGPSGYIYQTLPAVLWAWLRDPHDFAGGMGRIVALAGDTDTTAAIYGGLAGAAAGTEAIPRAWIDGLAEFPRSAAWMRRLAGRLAARPVALGASPESSLSSAASPGPEPLAWPLLLPRNLLFLTIVLLHGLRRLAPPY